MQTAWHFTTWFDLFDQWQTFIAGVFALVAAFGTIVVTRRLANRQIAAAREEADRVIAATRAQTEATGTLSKRQKERLASGGPKDTDGYKNGRVP